MNLVGLKFNRWDVVANAPSDKNNQSMFECRCECGAIRVILGTHLKSGKSRSCGCLKTEELIQRSLRHGYSRVGNISPIYSIWLAMKDRCLNPNCHAYKYYGGRGIKICERWKNSFEDFLEDIGKRPSKNHSLDRYPNNDGDYEPGNVRWATKMQQSGNLRSNRWVEHEGDRMILSEWGRLLNVNPATLGKFLNKGGTMEAAIERYST